MYYCIKTQNGIITYFAKKEDVDAGLVSIDWNEVIDYEPIQYNNLIKQIRGCPEKQFLMKLLRIL